MNLEEAQKQEELRIDAIKKKADSQALARQSIEIYFENKELELAGPLGE